MERHFEMIVTSEDDAVESFSLVEAPAIGVEWVALSQQREHLAEVESDKQLITGPVLIPEQVIPRQDAKGAYTIRFSRETIEKLQRQTMRQLREQSAISNIEHNPLNRIDQKRLFLVETWLKDSPEDKSNQHWPDLPIGTWFVTLKVEDPRLWKAIKEGKMKGFSIETLLQAEPVKKPTLTERAKLWLSIDRLQRVLLQDSYTDYPQGATDAAKRAIAWAEEHGWGGCGTAVGKARAHQLANREPISRDTIARMSGFSRHRANQSPYGEGCGKLMWDAWGGTAGIEWAARKLKEIDEQNA